MKKRIFVFTITFIIILVISGCVRETSTYEFSNSNDEIKEIDIVFLTKDNGNVQAEVLAEIPDEKIAEFLSLFKEIEFTKMHIGGMVWLEQGEAIRIIYANGDIEYISHYGQLFDPVSPDGYYNGMNASCDEEQLNNIIGKYYEKNGQN